MKCSGGNVILRGIVHAVSGFPLHFMLYRGNLDCFSNRVGASNNEWTLQQYVQPLPCIVRIKAQNNALTKIHFKKHILNHGASFTLNKTYAHPYFQLSTLIIIVCVITKNLTVICLPKVVISCVENFLQMLKKKSPRPVFFLSLTNLFQPREKKKHQ